MRPNCNDEAARVARQRARYHLRASFGAEELPGGLAVLAEERTEGKAVTARFASFTTDPARRAWCCIVVQSLSLS
jgi:hypothetical protein